MKKTLPILLLALAMCLTSQATNYYIAAGGNDSNNGTSTSTPWKTLNKLNSFFGSLNPGDNVYLHRGDVFYGKIVISKSGTADAPITIGAYGSGPLPVVSGFTTVSAWTNLGNNIWESSSAVSSLPTCNMVVINGVSTAMGRTPNYPNYYTWNSHSTSGSNTTVTTGLSGSPNWTGAELAIFTTSYTNERHTITAQSGGTLTYATPSWVELWQHNPAYFYQQFQIQNDIRTLDTLNEWYYNPSTKKLDVYNTIAPAGVKLATVDTLVWTNNNSCITLTNLAITGANKDAISIGSGSNLKIINCTITYVGGTAIYGITSVTQPGLRISSDTISQVNNSGIDLKKWYIGDTISYNSLKDINMLIGMQDAPHTISGNVVGIYTESDNAFVSYNNLDSTGIVGISFKGNNASIDHNFVNHTCYGNAVRDLGAIYTWNGLYAVASGTKVFNNIVLNTGIWCVGIFCDEGSNGIEIYNNTAYNTLRGIFLDDSYNINIHNNTTFNTNVCNTAIGSGIFLNNNPSLAKLRNLTIKNNRFIAKTAVDRALWVITTDSASVPKPFVSDSNYFAKPLGDNVNNIQTDMVGAPYVQRTLASWQALNGQDAHSHGSPKTITDTLDFNFQYNATSSPVTISLPYNYIDIAGAPYNGSLTLQPYTSAVLIKNGTLNSHPPAVNAGIDQVITLPTNTVNLNGSGTVSGATITSYNWTLISGPSASTITAPASATTMLTGLNQGVYELQLAVTDNLGATGFDTVQITVNPASGLLPAVNPGTMVNGLNYNYYQGSSNYTVVPDFSSLAPLKTGTTSTFSLSPAERAFVFSFNFTGYIDVPASGQYTFYTTSDDGSNLYIDNVLVVYNDGLHGAIEKSGTIGLQAGFHAISVGYFQQGGGDSLVVSYAGPGISKQAIPASLLFVLSVSGGNLVGLANAADQISSANQFAIAVYPNPFANSFTLNISGDAGEFKLLLVDAVGRVIWTSVGAKGPGFYQQRVNTASLQKGIYFIRVIQNKNCSVIKLEK